VQKSLPDTFYDEQVGRLSGLDKYPAIPVGQHELRRALRRISETDRKFIERLIGEIIDTRTVCPKPLELTEEAERLRRPQYKPLGNPACAVCNGSGWESLTRRVRPGGHEYEAEFARPCKCRVGSAA
jgi:hypothetical protein